MPNIQEVCLYLVATPVGNLDDITVRAIDVLRAVDFIAAEDTRHSKRLLNALQIDTPMLSLHEHNEKQRAEQLLQKLQTGKSIALISDAGTPLISDPGYHLVQIVRAAGVKVVPIPGACAAITALIASGLPTDRFMFLGFLPHKGASRTQSLQKACQQTCTVILYESVHRILDLLQLLVKTTTADRRVVVGRELTKTYERFYDGSAAELLEHFAQHSDEVRGEFVVLIAPSAADVVSDDDKVIETLQLLLAELPTRQAVSLAVKLTQEKRNKLYELALRLRDEMDFDQGEK